MFSDTGVNSGKDIVEQEDGGLGVAGTSQGHPGLLTTREGDTPFTDFGTVTTRHHQDIFFEGTGKDHFLVQVFVIRSAEEDVVTDGGVLDPRLQAEDSVSLDFIVSRQRVFQLHQPREGVKKRQLTQTNQPTHHDELTLVDHQVQVQQPGEIALAVQPRQPQRLHRSLDGVLFLPVDVATLATLAFKHAVLAALKLAAFTLEALEFLVPF